MVDEDALVHAAAAGGSWAFGRLWQLLSPTVAAYLRSRGVRDVDDVTSEVFLAAFARIGQFTGGGTDFRRYLFTVAHHKSVDDVRRRFGPQVPRQVELDAAADPRREPSAEDAALAGRLSPQLQAALAELPVAQREVLLLRLVADLDVDAVAEVLDRTPGAVKQLQHRALGTLRRTLAAVPAHPSGATGRDRVTAAGGPTMTTTT